MNGQKYVIKLDGFPNNQNVLPTKSKVKNENVSLTRVSTTNISVTHKFTTANTLPPQPPPSSHEQLHQPRQHQQLIKKRETISGNHTTHFQKSTHRVEYTDRQKNQNSRRQNDESNKNNNHQQQRLMPKSLTKDDDNNNYNQPSSSSSSSIVTLPTNNNNNKKNNNVRQMLYRTERMSKNSLQFGNKNNRSRVDPSERTLTESLKKLKKLKISKNRNRNVRSEEAADAYSDDNDDFDERFADLELLRTVKRMLLVYITEKPSRKLKSGEFTWTEIKPYIYNTHYPRFKEYLQEHEIRASNKMIIRCLKDLHISRRDGMLKKLRKERERRSKDAMDNLEVENTNSDGYMTYHCKR